MPISIIAAVAEDNCIGQGGKLPWNLPEDLKRFREVTMGKVVVMGRKTWESLPEKFRPLPGRKNAVITRQSDYPVPEGVEVSASIEAAIAAHASEEVVVIGGAEIYRQAMAMADCLFITHVHRTVAACDAYFPAIDLGIWEEVVRDDHEGYSFVEYRKRSGGL